MPPNSSTPGPRSQGGLKTVLHFLASIVGQSRIKAFGVEAWGLAAILLSVLLLLRAAG